MILLPDGLSAILNIVHTLRLLRRVASLVRLGLNRREAIGRSVLLSLDLAADRLHPILVLPRGFLQVGIFRKRLIN